MQKPVHPLTDATGDLHWQAQEWMRPAFSLTSVKRISGGAPDISEHAEPTVEAIRRVKTLIDIPCAAARDSGTLADIFKPPENQDREVSEFAKATEVELF